MGPRVLAGYFWGWSCNTLATWCKELTYWKRPWCWERLKAGGEGTTENEMVGWYHWLNGYEFEQALWVGDGQGSLAYCSLRVTELDMTERLNITLPTKVHLVKAMVFPVVMYGCESWTIKKAEHQRTGAFELWCWRRLLRVPWTARRSN